MIRLLLADDHDGVRSGLAELLANYEDLQLVASVPDGETAVSLAGKEAPDVVLMDINMPGMGGIEATRLIRRLRPETRVIMFTAFGDHGHVADAMAAGAAGFVVKGGDPRELLDQIRAAGVH
jgi:DNA-binding NarL/FixJ family response regulator